MADSTKVNTRINQIEMIKDIEVPEITDVGNLIAHLRHLGIYDTRLFYKAVLGCKQLLFYLIKKHLIEDLKEELAAIDARISEDQNSLSKLSEAAENAIGEGLV